MTKKNEKERSDFVIKKTKDHHTVFSNGDMHKILSLKEYIELGNWTHEQVETYAKFLNSKPELCQLMPCEKDSHGNWVPINRSIPINEIHDVYGVFDRVIFSEKHLTICDNPEHPHMPTIVSVFRSEILMNEASKGFTYPTIGEMSNYLMFNNNGYNKFYKLIKNNK